MFDLEKHNTFGLKIRANEGIFVDEVSRLATISHPENTIILGSGSDVLFVDDFAGTVLINKIKSLDITKDGDKFIVKVGGAYLLDELISLLLEKKIYGLENLSAIPGTVGAAPIQNVGAYGVEIGSLIKSVDVYDMDYKLAYTLMHDDCKFGYRTSYFKENKDRHLFITHVTFELSGEYKPCLCYDGLSDEKCLYDAISLRQKVIALRQMKLPDPKIVGNAGSFFKNPNITENKVIELKKEFDNLPAFAQSNGQYKVSAGFLIDKAGCRGITKGNAGTWEQQALVLVNRGNADPHEIVSLAKFVSARVKDRFDIDLTPEVRIYGRAGEIAWDTL